MDATNYSLIPNVMTLTFVQGHRAMRKNLVEHSFAKTLVDLDNIVSVVEISGHVEAQTTGLSLNGGNLKFTVL